LVNRREDRINALTNLGLTHTQANIYLASLRAGPATVKTLALIAGMAREDVYRIIPALIKTGLLQKHLSYPAIYEAVRPEQAIAILLKRKEEEYAESRRKGKDFVKQFQNRQIGSSISPSEEKTVWVVSDKKSPVGPLLIDTIQATTRSLDFTTRYNLFAYSMNNAALKTWIEELYNAVQRGVEIRMVLNRPKTGKLVHELTFSIQNSAALVKNPHFSYRYLPDAPECILILFDNDKCLIEVSPTHDVAVSPYIWTNNPVLVDLVKTYFRLSWHSAKPLL